MLTLCKCILFFLSALVVWATWMLLAETLAPSLFALQ